MKLRSLSAVFGGIAALAAVACSSSSNAGTGSASDSSGFIDQYCGYVASCCGTQNLPTDGKSCKGLLALSGGTYDAQKGQACIDGVKTASAANAAWCVDQTNPTNQNCNGVFSSTSGGAGSVQPGGTCKTDTDCAAGPSGSSVACRDYYNFDTKVDTEICQVETHGAAGDGPCLGSVTVQNGTTETTYNDSGSDDGGAHPSSGVFCFTAEGVTCDAASGNCKALGQPGDSCEGAQCVPGAYCNINSNKCVTSTATGSACTTSGECISGDYCDTSGSGNCTAQLLSGAACSTSDQCQSGSCSNGKCGAGFSSLGLAFLCGSSSSN